MFKDQHVSGLFQGHPQPVKERSASPETMVKWLARQHREIIYVHMNLFCCWKKISFHLPVVIISGLRVMILLLGIQQTTPGTSVYCDTQLLPHQVGLEHSNF